MTDTKTNTACRVIIVDDDEDFAGSIADILKSHGYPCAVVLTAEDACQVAERFEAQVALVDVCLGSESGLDVVAELKQIQPDVLCVMVSAYADTESAMQALHEGAQAYLQKPVDPRELLETMEDCSERLQNDHRRAAAEQTLREAHAQLERRNQRLAELRENAERFVDDVSHEFRTPLTVIKAYTSMLADGLGGPVTGEQAEYLGMTGKAVEDLTRMVNDLLDSSRLESSLRRVDRRRCKVAEIIRSVRPMLSSNAKARNIRIVEGVAPRVSDVFADEEKVRRTLVNFAVNALKFSPAGTQVTLWARELSHGLVEIGVTDQGRGISAEDLKVIFARFKRVGNTAGLSTRGFGLGLHIAKELAWLNLGRVHVKSTLGKGSTFSFTLPKCNRKAVLESYFGQLNEPSEETAVSALVVTTAEDERSLDRAREFLVSECRPMDLVLADKKTHRLILLGWTDLPENWAHRIETARDESMKDNPSLRNPMMRITTIGTWQCPTKSEEAMDVVLKLLSGRALRREKAPSR
jgi:hypothetical protein